MAANKLCIFVLFLFLSNLSKVLSQEVVLHPYSRLVPVGTDVYFTCELRNAQIPYWVVNTIEVLHNFQIEYLSERGIYILDDVQSNGITTLNLRVNSSYSYVNNTHIACRADGIRSKTADLLTVNYSPLSQNPSLWQKNSTAMLLQWSSPYLWPGDSLELYNISIRNHDNDQVIYHQIDANFDDRIVDFIFVLEEEQQANCSEFTFGISAVSTDSQELPIAYITGGYASDLQGVNINAVALFRADGVPVLVQVQIELPQSICLFQELNYSIFIEDGDGDVLTKLGPINYHGPGNLHHEIIHSLEKGQEYVAEIKAESVLGNITSHYSFNTKLETASIMLTSIMPGPIIVQESETYIYKIALGIISFLLIVTFTSVFMCVCIYCIRKQREKSPNRRVNRICNTLVPNPIYDGPVYESVLPNFEALTAITQQTNIDKSETELNGHTSSVPSAQDITQPNSARYVDHPIQLSQLSIDKNESEPNGGSQLQVTRSERITHFISSVADDQRETFFPNSETKATTNSTEETYTLMRSAGTLTLSVSAGLEEKQHD